MKTPCDHVDRGSENANLDLPWSGCPGAHHALERISRANVALRACGALAPTALLHENVLSRATGALKTEKKSSNRRSENLLSSPLIM